MKILAAAIGDVGLGRGCTKGDRLKEQTRQVREEFINLARVLASPIGEDGLRRGCKSGIASNSRVPALDVPGDISIPVRPARALTARDSSMKDDNQADPRRKWFAGAAKAME